MRAEFTDVAALRAHRAAGADLRGAVLTGLDLTGPDDDALLRTALDGALLLGCRLTEVSARRAEAGGALLFPVIPGLPYQTYRAELYTPAELFAGFDPGTPESYLDTLDARIYRYGKEQGRLPHPAHAIAERLHDHSITEALTELLTDKTAVDGRGPVAVMGGHALARDEPGYRAAARLGIALGRAGFTVLTGGGPGAMEAVPLGVRLHDAAEAEVDAALTVLAAAPVFGTAGRAVDATAIGRWLAAALDVPLPPAGERPRTIGIPTWFYGHEPPNAFCDRHAKYFANSVREDGLLTVATGGVIYIPGSAGTVQEVFQDYTQNHYASLGPPAPMVFLGVDFWTRRVPAAELVRTLAAGRDIEPWIVVTDSAAEAVATLVRYAG